MTRRLTPRVKLYGTPARFCLRWWKGGKQSSVTLGRMPREEADLARTRKQAEVDGEVLLGRPIPAAAGRAMTVRGLLLGYLLGIKDRAPDHQANEHARARALTDLIGDEKVAALTTKGLERYALQRHEAGKSRETIWGELRLLKRAGGAAEDTLRDVKLPPLPRTKILPDDARPPRALTEEEVRSLMGAALQAERPEFATLIQFLAWCPCRPAEALSLTLADCERLLSPSLPRAEKQVRFRVTKGGEGRGFRPVAEPALEAVVRAAALRGEVGPEARLWVTRSGSAWSVRYAGRVLGEMAKAAGVEDVTLYDLRKLGVSRVYETVGNPKAAMRYTGHKRAETVLRYLQARPAEVDAAAPRITWTTTPKLRAVGRVG